MSFTDLPNDQFSIPDQRHAIDLRTEMLFAKLIEYENSSYIRLFPCERPEHAATEPDLLFKYTGDEWIRQQFGIIFSNYVKESKPNIVRDIEQIVMKLQMLSIQRLRIVNRKQVRETIENQEHTVDSINDRLTALTIEQDHIRLELIQWTQALIEAGKLEYDFRIRGEDQRHWLETSFKREGHDGKYFVRNNEEGLAIQKEIERRINKLKRIGAEFNELVTKRGIIITMMNRGKKVS